MPTAKNQKSQNGKKKRALITGITGQDGFYLTQLLLDKGADVNHQDNEGKTALFYYGKLLDFMKLLIENGANINHQNNKGETALFNCISPHTISLLIEHGADTNHQNNKGETALFYNIKYRKYEQQSFVVAVLLNNGADKTIQNIHGTSVSQEEINLLCKKNDDV